MIKKLFLSLGGIGFISFAPGTFASIFSFFALYYFSLNIYYFIGILLISLLVTHFTIQTNEDPSWIVIDEFLGVGLGFYFLPLHQMLVGILFIALFRIFDIFKPFPINFIEKKLSQYNATKALSIIIDDLLASAISIALLKIFY